MGAPLCRGIFLDIETNGLDCFRHQVLDIAYRVIDLSNGSPLYSFKTLVQPDAQYWYQSNQDSLKINGFSQLDKFSEALTLKEVRSRITSDFLELNVHKDSDIFICQNPSFDRPFFTKIISSEIQEKHHWPYHWLDLASMYWAVSCQKGARPDLRYLSKDSIAKSLGLSSEASPHRAMQGVDHLLACYKKLFL